MYADDPSGDGDGGGGGTRALERNVKQNQYNAYARATPKRQARGARCAIRAH